MKHFHSCLILLCCFAIHATGQRTKTIELTYQPSDFVFNERDGLLSIDSYRHMIQYGSNVSEPALPFILVHVLIGSDEKYVGLNASYQDVSYSKGMQVRCNPTYSIRHSISRTPPPITPQEYSKTSYPSEFVRYTGTHHVDGYTYISFFVSPFVFLTQEKELLLHEKVILNIQLKQEATSKNRVGRAMRNAIKSIVINKDEMATLYPEPKREMTRTGLAANSDFDYLIITRDSLKDAFQKLADWKTRKGVPTKVLTLEEIDTINDCWQPCSWEYVPLQLAIKRAIRKYYIEHNTKYVLLGGDDDIIFAEMCYLQYNDQRPHYNRDAASDLFYACMEGQFDWDKFHAFNAYSPAEYRDDIDMHPSLAVSRLSVSSIVDAQTQVNRIIDYERGPGLNEWNDKYLSVGCAFDPDYLHFGKTDVCRKGQLFKDSLESYGISETFMLYDSLTSHPNNSHYDVTSTHFKEQLQNGFSFIQFDGHGDYDCYQLENSSYFYNQDAMDFTNPVYSMIVTSACYTNGFDQDCLGESFMRNPQGKIIAYWGGTLDVLGDTIEARLSAHLDKINIKLYKHLLEDGLYHIGDAVNAARLDFISVGNMPYDTPFRWNLLCLNLLGDPEMPIFTKKPMEFEGLDIELMNNNQLHFGFMNNNMEFSLYNLCVMSIDDNGANLYEIVEDIDGGGVTLTLPVGHDYSICATQPGFKPYIVTVYRRGFVQNDTIANESIVWSNQVMIGCNVTTSKPQGHVFVKKGQMTIKTPQGTTIQNGFTLEKGATLVIDPTIQYIYHEVEEQ